MYALQVQASYVVHDFGHRAVTNNVTIDYFFQHIFTNIAVGFCAEFLQIYHNLHHTFPHKVRHTFSHKIRCTFSHKVRHTFLQMVCTTFHMC